MKKKPRSYVTLDSDNGQTLWLQNFPSLTEALFWLDTGLKPEDTDSSSSYQQWKSKHAKEIEDMKNKLREMPKIKKGEIKKAEKQSSKKH